MMTVGRDRTILKKGRGGGRREEGGGRREEEGGRET